uniref:LPD7 domain-containing protein n=1 Tax=Rhizobium fredii TaxID=380 RepID=UPI000560DF23
SYGGGARVGAMLNYVSRSGELKVEDENGRILEGREELARIRGDWDHLFQNRAESRDIGSFTVEIAASGFASDEALHEQVRSTLTSGFGDRRYAYAIAKNESGSVTVQGLVVLRSGQGERLTGDAKAAGIIQGRYDASAAAGEAAATFSFHGYGNGVEFGASRLRGLVDRHEDVRNDHGHLVADEKAAGDLVQKEWRGELHSRKSRDVMHVIMSARAGTDVVAFEGAVRDFLAHQFAGHRYVFAMHDPASDPKETGEGGKRPHVHAHAIVAMKSDSGDRIETTPAVFRQWRSVMAEKAREHGIEMEMTDRREFAAPPAFTRTQVRPVSREGRTEHVGTSEAAQARYDAKRGGRRMVAKSDRSRQYTKMAQETWQKIAVAAGDRHTIAYASEHRTYLEVGLSAAQMETSAAIIYADFGSNFRANLVTLQEMVLEGQELRETSRAEFETYEKKVETALFKLERSVAPEDRADFDEVAGLARDFVNQKRELVELYEQRNEALSEQRREERELASEAAPENERREALVNKVEPAPQDHEYSAEEIEEVRKASDELQREMPEPATSAHSEIALTPSAEIAAPIDSGQQAPTAEADSKDIDRSFPDEIWKRYYVQSERNGTQRVFADHKASREIFQDAGQHLRTKVDDVQAIRLMVETAAHRGWTSIDVKGSEDFRREAWIEAHARGIGVNGYKPTELDWQEVARREQAWLRNEITQGREQVAEHAAKRQELRNDPELEPTSTSTQPREASSTNSYRDGVQGKLSEVGERPYKDNEKNDKSPYVVIATEAGSKTVWGVGLPDALDRADAKVGDIIDLRETGMETVRKTVIVEVDGHPTRVVKDVERRAWDVSVLERDRANNERSSNPNNDQVKSDRRAVQADEPTRTDPAQQHIPRLQQLEREQMEQKERDRDDRDR